MKVIAVPVRHRLAIAAIFFCVPLAALETLVVRRASLRMLLSVFAEKWTIGVAMFCLALCLPLFRGKRWALDLLTGGALVWLVTGAWTAIRMRHTGLGLFTIALAPVFLSLYLKLKQEMSRSFFDPMMSWYQGMPKTLPHIKCRLAWDHLDVECKVGRVDREGAFLFCTQTPEGTGSGLAPLSSLTKKTNARLTLQFREREVSCNARPMVTGREGQGAGLRFVDIAPDAGKQLGDFIETLKGEGYVSF